jgi:hypothetical protein
MKEPLMPMSWTGGIVDIYLIVVLVFETSVRPVICSLKRGFEYD